MSALALLIIDTLTMRLAIPICILWTYLRHLSPSICLRAFPPTLSATVSTVASWYSMAHSPCKNEKGVHCRCNEPLLMTPTRWTLETLYCVFCHQRSSQILLCLFINKDKQCNIIHKIHTCYCDNRHTLQYN